MPDIGEKNQQEVTERTEELRAISPAVPVAMWRTTKEKLSDPSL